MGPVELVVMYPPPKDVEEFERRYRREHAPMAVEELAGKTRMVGTRVLASPEGRPAFHRIAEVHFPSLEALQTCAAPPAERRRRPTPPPSPPAGRPSS